MIENPNYCYSKHDKEMYVWEVLAYSMYDVMLEANRKNLIAFMYECIKSKAVNLQDYAEKEEHEYLSLVQSISMTLDNIYADPYVDSLRDFICKPVPDDYTPFYLMPRIYRYDPNYDYANDEYYCQ